MSGLGVERRDCTCKWMGDWIIAFDRDCPRFERHMNRVHPVRRLKAAEATLTAIREHALDAEVSELRGFVLGITDLT